MKKFHFFISFLLLVFISCKKENGVNNRQNSQDNPEDAVLITKGILNFSSGESSSGIVKIYKKSNGRYLLALEEFSFKNNVDLNLYLSKSNAVDHESAKLFSFQCVNRMVYEIPASIDVMAFRYILITSDRHPDTIASAELSS